LVVWVRVEIKYLDNVVATSAVVNSGYEADEPEIHIPIGLARRLGISLESLTSEKYRTVGSDVKCLYAAICPC
jgi:hypothetical protein